MRSISILLIFVFIQCVYSISYILVTKKNAEYFPQELLKNFGEKVTRESLLNPEGGEFDPEFSVRDENKPIPTCSGENRTTEVKNAIIGERYRWYKLVNGKYQIPAVIDSKFSQSHRRNIRRGMNIIQKQLCFEFWVFDNALQLEGYDYAFIHGDHGGCTSYIGRLGQGKQDVTLEGSCVTDISTIVHELLHLVGLHHEHQRSDRDKYIDIFWDNVDENENDNFDLLKESEYTTFGEAYDTKSLMHYSSNSFTKNSQDTMRTKNGDRIGWNTDMTQSDLNKVRKMYKC